MSTDDRSESEILNDMATEFDNMSKALDSLSEVFNSVAKKIKYNYVGESHLSRREGLLRTPLGESENDNFVSKKRTHHFVKKIFGRILNTLCTENNERIKGYKIHITYNQTVFLTIGPFKSYDFTITVKKTLLQELENWKKSDEEIKECFSEIKEAIYKIYPPIGHPKEVIKLEEK